MQTAQTLKWETLVNPGIFTEPELKQSLAEAVVWHLKNPGNLPTPSAEIIRIMQEDMQDEKRARSFEPCCMISLCLLTWPMGKKNLALRKAQRFLVLHSAPSLADVPQLALAMADVVFREYDLVSAEGMFPALHQLPDASFASQLLEVLKRTMADERWLWQLYCKSTRIVPLFRTTAKAARPPEFLRWLLPTFKTAMSLLQSTALTDEVCRNFAANTSTLLSMVYALWIRPLSSEEALGFELLQLLALLARYSKLYNLGIPTCQLLNRALAADSSIVEMLPSVAESEALGGEGLKYTAFVLLDLYCNEKSSGYIVATRALEALFQFLPLLHEELHSETYHETVLLRIYSQIQSAMRGSEGDLTTVESVLFSNVFHRSPLCRRLALDLWICIFASSNEMMLNRYAVAVADMIEAFRGDLTSPPVTLEKENLRVHLQEFLFALVSAMMPDLKRALVSKLAPNPARTEENAYIVDLLPDDPDLFTDKFLVELTTQLVVLIGRKGVSRLAEPISSVRALNKACQRKAKLAPTVCALAWKFIEELLANKSAESLEMHVLDEFATLFSFALEVKTGQEAQQYFEKHQVLVQNKDLVGMARIPLAKLLLAFGPHCQRDHSLGSQCAQTFVSLLQNCGDWVSFVTITELWRRFYLSSGAPASAPELADASGARPFSPDPSYSIKPTDVLSMIDAQAAVEATPPSKAIYSDLAKASFAIERILPMVSNSDTATLLLSTWRQLKQIQQTQLESPDGN